MRLDADEYIGSDLAQKLSTELNRLPLNVSGVKLQRRHIFMGRWIRHGGRFPLNILRVWRRGKAHVEQRWMDEHVILTEGSTVTFVGKFSDHNLNYLTFFTDKHNKYAVREAVDVMSQRFRLIGPVSGEAISGRYAGSGMTRWVKEVVYNRMPIWLGPLTYFLYRYVFQLGFLDGRVGLIYHGLQAGWYRFLVAAKVEELDRLLRPLEGIAERRQALETATGLRIFPDLPKVVSSETPT
jgi:hypothetical protein